MARPVTITQYQAADGSLHPSAEAADRHDVYTAQQARIARVAALIEADIDDALLYRKAWADLDVGNRKSLLEELAEAFIKHAPNVAERTKK